MKLNMNEGSAGLQGLDKKKLTARSRPGEGEGHKPKNIDAINVTIATGEQEVSARHKKSGQIISETERL